MIAFCILAIAVVAGLSVVTDTFPSVGVPSKAVFSEGIRPVTLNFSTLVLVEEETIVVDFDVECSPLAVVVAVAVATP
jgi:hypothetical protein